jgi:hypothetical protein
VIRVFMDIWQFNDPDPLRPFFRVLERQAPDLLVYAHRLFCTGSRDERAELLRLARGLVAGSAPVRAAIRVLVFSPPVEDELGHFRRLIRWFPCWLPPGWTGDPSLCERIAELNDVCLRLEAWLPKAVVIEAAVKRRWGAQEKKLAQRAAPCDPAVRRLLLSRLTRRLPGPLTPGLRRRLLLTPDLSYGQLCELLAAASRLPGAGVLRHWEKVRSLAAAGRRLSLCPAGVQPPSPHQELRLVSWNRRNPEELAFMERLVSYQANELEAVCRLAREVSLRTRRVVVTLHNASLGAATGWGIPSFSRQIPEEGRAAFLERVHALQRGFREEPPHPDRDVSCREDDYPQAGVRRLFSLWSRRLARPHLLRNLRDLRAGLLVNELPTQEWETLYRASREVLEQCSGALPCDRDLAAPTAPPSTARRRVEEILCWFQEKKKTSGSFFVLFWSLLAAGEEMLAASRIADLVLPVIDKFFISSQRERDLEYLPLFRRLARSRGSTPLFLLIDDTSRATQPSLQLALERWRHRWPFMGLGVFGGDQSDAEPAVETILARSPDIDLFALRPLSQCHNPVSLETLLTRRPGTFLTPEAYDSSWKDNLAFLYQGTRVAPLAGQADQWGEFSPVLITSQGPMAFGTFYRLRLRRIALSRLGFGGTREPSSLDLLWRQYAGMANLL